MLADQLIVILSSAARLVCLGWQTVSLVCFVYARIGQYSTRYCRVLSLNTMSLYFSNPSVALNCFADGCLQMSPLYLPAGYPRHQRLHPDAASPTEFGGEMTSTFLAENLRRFQSPSQCCSTDVLSSLMPLISQAEVTS